MYCFVGPPRENWSMQKIGWWFESGQAERWGEEGKVLGRVGEDRDLDPIEALKQEGLFCASSVDDWAWDAGGVT